jgi:hypothetical protein
MRPNCQLVLTLDMLCCTASTFEGLPEIHKLIYEINFV